MIALSASVRGLPDILSEFAQKNKYMSAIINYYRELIKGLNPVLRKTKLHFPI